MKKSRKTKNRKTAKTVKQRGGMKYGLETIINSVLGRQPGINIYTTPGYDLTRKSPKSPKSPRFINRLEDEPASIDTIKDALKTTYPKLDKNLITEANIKAAVKTLPKECRDKDNNYTCSQRGLSYGNPSNLYTIKEYISQARE